MLKNYPVNIASAGKSMASIVFGIAIDQGYFSLDDKISTYIDDIQSITRDELDKITVRQLLTMTSGLDDLLNMSYPNGQGWEYSDAWNLMFNILESTTQQSVDEYSKENLFDKIGMNNTEFRDSTKTLMQLRDAKPIFSDWKPRQVFTTSNDFVKFGQLILNHGVYQGQQIISNSYLIQALSDCKENPAYGFLFWLNEKNGAIAAGTGEIIETNIIPNAPKDTVAALGMGDKKLYIVPSLNLTIARHGSAAYGEHFAFTIYDHELWYYINKCLGT